MKSPQTKKLIFLVGLFVFFILLFMMLLTGGERIAYDVSIHYYELACAVLGILCFPASIFLSGTGILIFLIISSVLLLLSSQVLSNVMFAFGVPLLILLQFLARRQADRVFGERRSLFLDAQKALEKLNDKKDSREFLLKRKGAMESEIQRFSRLRDYISRVNLNVASEHLYRIILDYVSKNVRNADIYFLFLSDHRGALELSNFIVRGGGQDVHLRSNKSDVFNEWVMRYRQPLMISNISEDYRFQVQSAESLLYPASRSVIACPLVTDNKPLGMIRIDSKNAERFHLNDFRLLVTITNLSALFLRNAEFFKQTQRLSVTDGLTGLYRPHYLFHEVQKHFESNRPESIPAVGSLLMMDLDHFKRVNDRFGHVVGDNVLIQVARIISRHCPDSGFAVRYGGEEFALFLPGVPGAPAVKLAEKIRHSVADRKIHVRREKIRMTLSIGVASYPGEGEDVKSLIEKADTRLYEAKKKGRNRTVARS